MVTVCCLVFIDGESSTASDSSARGAIVVIYAARGVIVETVEETIMSAPGAYVERGVIVGIFRAIIFAAAAGSAEIGVIIGTSAAR